MWSVSIKSVTRKYQMWQIKLNVNSWNVSNQMKSIKCTRLKNDKPNSSNVDNH